MKPKTLLEGSKSEAAEEKEKRVEAKSSPED